MSPNGLLWSSPLVTSRLLPSRLQIEAIEWDADTALGLGLPVGAEFLQRSFGGGSDFRFLGATPRNLKDAPNVRAAC